MVSETQSFVEEGQGVLADARIVYVILYVSDLDRSRDFYENKLGLAVLEEDDDSVKYDTGLVILMLNRAGDYGISLAPGRHEFAEVVFLVDDANAIRAALEARGVELGTAFPCDPGIICDFYDPDGHWLTLYEPNEEAMTWPSGEKIRRVWRAAGRGHAPIIGPAAVVEKNPAEWRLEGKPILYLFLFIRNPQEAQIFYNRTMGLLDLEGGPCSTGQGGDEDGVIKYSGGGTMLTTHRVWETRNADDLEHPCPPRLFDPLHMGTMATVFHVDDIEQMQQNLIAAGITFPGNILRSEIGAIAKFSDPSQHVFYLYQPSSAALEKPSGVKIKDILAAAV